MSATVVNWNGFFSMDISICQKGELVLLLINQVLSQCQMPISQSIVWHSTTLIGPFIFLLSFPFSVIFSVILSCVIFKKWDYLFVSLHSAQWQPGKVFWILFEKDNYFCCPVWCNMKLQTLPWKQLFIQCSQGYGCNSCYIINEIFKNITDICLCKANCHWDEHNDPTVSFSV